MFWRTAVADFIQRADCTAVVLKDDIDSSTLASERSVPRHVAATKAGHRLSMMGAARESKNPCGS